MNLRSVKRPEALVTEMAGHAKQPIIPLIIPVEAIEPHSAEKCARTALTHIKNDSRRCVNPFCNAPMGEVSSQGKHRRYCSDRCRLDGYALRRAKALLNKVGIVRFHTLLEMV